MTSGKCLDCGASWDSKCHKCRNRFFDERTQEQFQCQHRRLTTERTPEKCVYSGCTYPEVATIAK